MNVLFVVHEFPPLGGGAGVWVRTLADAVAADGGQVEVLTLGSPGVAYAPTAYPVTPVAVGRASTAYGDVLSLLRFQRAARRAVAQRVAAGGWDCVYAHFTVPAGWAALAGVDDAGAAGRLPVVVDISGADIYDPDRFAIVRPLLNMLNRRVVRRAKLVIAPSRDMAEHCRRLTGVLPEVVYRAVDTDRFRPEAANPELLRNLGIPKYVSPLPPGDEFRPESAEQGMLRNSGVLKCVHPLPAGEGLRPESVNPELLRTAGTPEDVHPLPTGEGRVRGDDRKSKVILTVGRLVERKNLPFALAITAELVKRGLPVYQVIAGEGPERPKLERLAAAMGISDRIIFAGRVADADLPGLVAAADLFLLTSHYEALGIVLLEALAAGTPVLAPAIGGIPEIAPADAFAARWLPPAESPAQWADHVSALLERSQAAQVQAPPAFATTALLAGWRERLRAAATAAPVRK
ncbi:MAG TPA: glycosyltransferase family 4 protein [bacterium]|nr:glycosyltransferase family 4 protein [bacterium]